jgi:hypothetical protein
MEEKIIPLQNIRKLDERIFPELLKKNSYLTCINKRTGLKKRIAIKALYDNDKEFWLKDNSCWSYLVNTSVISSIQQMIKELDLELEQRLTREERYKRNREYLIEDNLKKAYDDLAGKDPKERISSLSQALKRINRVVHSREISIEERSDILVEVSSYSYLVNKVTLDEVVKLTDMEARKATFEMARMTEKIISSLTSLLDDNHNEIPFFYSLIEKSNGVTLRHMVRTFVLSYRFLLFFNTELTDSGLASKTRVKFHKSYKHWYHSLIPHISEESLTLESVFKGGMRPVPEKEIGVYSAGFLLHDIGKQRYIDYYEGTDDYDSRKVESHAKTGYRMLLQKTVYSDKIAAIAGYHHEYYGHASGYGYYRELCALMKLGNENSRQDSCISYDLKDLEKFNSLSYLPVKILEIVDVFDAITDPGRTYKSHMDTFQALKFMKEEFVINNKKIDIILFELFVKFLHESGFIN